MKFHRHGASQKRFPKKFQNRRLYKHNPTVTLMRTTREECAELGFRIARKLNAALGPVTLFIPLRGLSLISRAGQVFHDAPADEALFHALRDHLEPRITVREMDTDINDQAFAVAMADTLHELVTNWTAAKKEPYET